MAPIYREGEWVLVGEGEEGGGRVRRDLITHFKLLLLNLLLRSYVYGYIEMCLREVQRHRVNSKIKKKEITHAH